VPIPLVLEPSGLIIALVIAALTDADVERVLRTSSEVERWSEWSEVPGIVSHVYRTGDGIAVNGAAAASRSAVGRLNAGDVVTAPEQTGRTVTVVRVTRRLTVRSAAVAAATAARRPAATSVAAIAAATAAAAARTIATCRTRHRSNDVELTRRRVAARRRG